MKSDKIRSIIILTLAIFLSSCEQPETAESTPDIVMEQVDLILTNGKILTVDSEFSIANTVVVNDGRIVVTGDASLLEQYESSSLVDLDGKILMPGFIDSHTHIRGRPERYIELGETESIAEIQSLIRRKADELGPDEWITGYGWSEDELAEGRRPLRQDLDAAAPRNHRELRET